MDIKKPRDGIKICVKGITSGEWVKELNHSRNLAPVRLLMEKGLDVSAYDEITMEDLRRDHISVPRNPLLFKQLFLLKYVEDVGGGTPDMISLNHIKKNIDPQIFLSVKILDVGVKKGAYYAAKEHVSKK